VRLWKVSTHELVRTLAHEDGIYCLTFTADGRQLITGGRDEKIGVWDVDTGRLVRMQRGHAGTINGLSISRDGTRLVSCGDDQTARIWDLATGQELLSLKPNANNVCSVSFSPDGSCVAAGSFYGLLTVWDARPLTAEVRAELVAADLLERLLTEVKSDEELVRLIRERSPLDEKARRRALEMASLRWKARSSFPPLKKGAINRWLRPTLVVSLGDVPSTQPFSRNRRKSIDFRESPTFRVGSVACFGHIDRTTELAYEMRGSVAPAPIGIKFMQSSGNRLLGEPLAPRLLISHHID
jgi:hypothetical protein